VCWCAAVSVFRRRLGLCKALVRALRLVPGAWPGAAEVAGAGWMGCWAPGMRESASCSRGEGRDGSHGVRVSGVGVRVCGFVQGFGRRLSEAGEAAGRRGRAPWRRRAGAHTLLPPACVSCCVCAGRPDPTTSFCTTMMRRSTTRPSPRRLCAGSTPPTSAPCRSTCRIRRARRCVRPAILLPPPSYVECVRARGRLTPFKYAHRGVPAAGSTT